MKLFDTVRSYVLDDWRQSPWRFAGESYNYVVSVISSVIFTITMPNPPLWLLYPLWLSGLFLMILCARSRGSTGMFMLYLTLATLDTIGYVRLILWF